ncbi:unnamed protein product [Lepeophtheirus salmonis]|uniref:(salmon louse) hypothetical protein n=1 Tax=Lepeophtheirus salmonis TaxID=72036 RepID=A0A7R8D996_LEPSM|nr:unnamed protein product [Lepeophtheirus salmonis]CAF3015819.1 unnamed protein product [Lepeophtheirus salmonis]
MQKQTLIGSLLSEKSSLCLQMEKLEKEFKRRESGSSSNRLIHRYPQSQHVRDYVVSSLDTGVTRKVKSAYSSLYSFSIWIGFLLRQYPLLRIGVMVYGIVLHLWPAQSTLNDATLITTSERTPIAEGFPPDKLIGRRRNSNTLDEVEITTVDKVAEDIDSESKLLSKSGMTFVLKEPAQSTLNDATLITTSERTPIAEGFPPDKLIGKRRKSNTLDEAETTTVDKETEDIDSESKLLSKSGMSKIRKILPDNLIEDDNKSFKTAKSDTSIISLSDDIDDD